MWGRNRILGVSARKDKAAQRLTAAGGELDPRPPFPAIPAIAVTNQYCRETRTEKSVKDREPRMICLNFQGEQNISIYLTERIRRTAYSIEGMYSTYSMESLLSRCGFGCDPLQPFLSSTLQC